MKQIFTKIYQKRAWGSQETVSGIGARLSATTVVREQLPVLFKKYKIKRLLDLGCGDFNWMKEIVSNLDYYIGIDVVDEIINENNKRYKSETIEFQSADILQIDLNEYQVDAIIIADVFTHLSHDNILAILYKIQNSGIKYVLITNYINNKSNYNIKNGDWRPLNLCIEPFNLKPSLEFIKYNDPNDIIVRKSDDRTLSLWLVKKMKSILNDVKEVLSISDPVLIPVPTPGPVSEDIKSPSISIIITGMQTQNYIEECLDSVENQTYFKDNDDFEVLVGVDACQYTLNKLTEIRYKYRNLSIFMMHSNMGTYVTTNTLLDLTSSENIIRFDSDDIMLPEMISEIMENSDDYDVIRLSYNRFNGYIKKRGVLTDGVIFYKKNVIKLAGGYRDWICSADTEFLNRINNRVKIKKIEKGVFRRRIHDNALTVRPTTRYGSETRKKYESQIRYYDHIEDIEIVKVTNTYDLIKEVTPISIIITAWKSQDYIEECLNSIEEQTYFKDNDRFEILIGIDSCHNTLKKVINIRHKYRNLKIFMMHSNMGTYVTTNTLLDLALYDNLIRFDSDDVMLPEMVGEIQQNIGKYNLIRFKFNKLYDNVIETPTPGKIYPHGVAFFKRSLLNELGGYQPWSCAADSELLIRGKSIIDELFLNKPLFNRRFHANSLTASQEFGYKSEIRNKYKNLIGDHDSIKIERITNDYTEY